MSSCIRLSKPMRVIEPICSVYVSLLVTRESKNPFFVVNFYESISEICIQKIEVAHFKCHKRKRHSTMLNWIPIAGAFLIELAGPAFN